jgi:hypothetical protein
VTLIESVELPRTKSLSGSADTGGSLRESLNDTDVAASTII